jgi:hypothetical protein
MTAEFIVLGHNIEEERLHIIVESFGTEEEFREKAQVLAVDWILAAIDFKEGIFAVAIDFIAGRMLRRTLEFVPPGDIVRIHVFETEFADVEDLVSAVFLRVGGSMPGVNFVAPKVNALDLARGSTLLL